MSKVNVRRHGLGWQYRFEIASVDGKRKEKSKCGFRTKADALAAGTKALAEYNETGTTFKPSEMSVADYMNYWYETYCKSNLRLNTCVAYKGAIKNHINPALGEYKLKALRPDTVQRFIDGLKLRGLSKNWTKNIKSTLSGALDYAVHPCQFIKSNPCRYVRTPKFDKKQADRTCVTVENWKKITERFRDTKYYIPLMIGYYTGARISEVLGLTWNDIDFEKRTITISHQLLHEGRYFKLSPCKTDSSARTVVFGDTLYNLLSEHKKRCMGHILRHRAIYYLDGENVIAVPSAVCKTLPHPLFVCTDYETGELITQNSFKYCSRVIHYELGIMGFCFHSLRHTHATMLVESGANLKDVQRRLGHSTIRTTMDVYTAATDSGARAVADIFELDAVKMRSQDKK